MSISNENDYLNYSEKTEINDAKQHESSIPSYNVYERNEDLYESEASYIRGYN
ncbi:hypothetical protein RI844_15775 [Thalassotalea fonticola]|uniref:Uncharacterized protein n=1 Tax=Thalassotalea fonticola TaxID=3065649 RepID=A0ABZ0GN33_9GAMM|nr:hypothetical protein RI844_15775 [Colwelliaceae bacterium S1-1]